ncbi:NAD-P-binding protein [Epithele typhae]|uniref:NAD-P-binding protein n=1 Tax=Epithele typhae TaxID=378194 RepID=UPI00200781F3|nr:NAD-P-binding protein [Epithele typhae]KAH9940009.1 NAD-P-binding protein [Epithele typhae]
MSTLSSKKLILVIGGTGAQGLAVVDALLKPAADGVPSPYAVRVMTRDPANHRARDLVAKGVEVVQGTTDDFTSVMRAMEGAYGAFVNTDSFTIGEEKEVYTGMRLFEAAKQLGTLRHYVWSGLDYSFKKGGYDPKYRVVHHDAKARVGDWMRAQLSVVGDTDMSWTILSTMVYMEMLNGPMMGPLNKRADGTYVFASPIGAGAVPMVSLADVGFFARHIFDHRAATSARELEIASARVDWPTLVETFARVTGKPAVYLPLGAEEWFALWEAESIARPLASERAGPDGSTTWRENFECWWAQYRDEVITRDWAWLREVHPGGHTLESWMRETGYTGDLDFGFMKSVEDGKGPRLNIERIAAL